MSRSTPTAQVYTDEEFLDPLDADTWTSLLILADHVGCAVITADRRCRELADARRVEFRHPPQDRRMARREVRLVDDE